MTVDGARAARAPGPVRRPALTITMGVADFVRIAGRDLDPGKALIDGRWCRGRLRRATKLGEMFGEPAP